MGYVVVREICTLIRLPYMEYVPVAVPLNAHTSTVQVYIHAQYMYYSTYIVHAKRAEQ